MSKKLIIFLIFQLSFVLSHAQVVDEVVWVVGDEAILRSDIEVTRIQAAMEGVKWSGDPDCAIPEQIAVQKLFLHQAAIDSIDKDVTEADITAQLDTRINYMIEQISWRSIVGRASPRLSRPCTTTFVTRCSYRR